MHANLTRRAAIQWSGAAFALPVVQPAYLENGMPFTPKFVDLVRNFTTVQGTGPVALGSAVSGYTSLAAALNAGDQFYYCIQGVDKPQEREVGRGTMQADGRIAREAVQGELTPFTGGTKTIALVTAAEWFTQASAGASIEVASRAALAAAASTRGPAMLTERGREGLFAWDPGDHSAKVALDAQQGLHVAPAGDPTGASGAWIRRFEGPVNPLWFGIIEGNGKGAANSVALQAMLAALRSRAVNASNTYQGLEPLRFPPGQFEFADTIDITGGTFIIEGCASGLANGRGTILKFPAGVTGIRTQLHDTAGADATDTDHYSGTASIIRGLYLIGGFAGSEAEAHGIHLRSRAIIENCVIANFAGDGIYSRASATGSPRGNTNNSIVRSCRIENCRNGMFIDGTDANIWTITGVDVSLNRQWGIWDSSFLGNTYVGCHSASNGYENGAVAIAPTMVSDGTNRYGVIAGQEAGASTNPPSGTATDNSWWYFISAGGPIDKYPLWASGTTYRAGGAAHSDNANARNVFVGCYAETGQGLAQLVTPTLVLGGMLPSHMRGTAGALTAFGGSNGLTTNGNFTASGNVQARTTGSSFGPTSGAAANSDFNLDNTSTQSTLNFRKWSGGSATTDAFIGTANTGLRINHTTTIRLLTGGTARMLLTANELRPETDNAMDLGLNGQRWETIFGYSGDFTTQVKVGGIKVLGAQGAAVADAPALTAADAATAAAAPTQAEFNALVAEFNKLRSDLGASRSQLNLALARLRAHGLIAA